MGKTVYEALGQERHEYLNLVDEYRRLLGLVQEIKDGTVNPDHVTVEGDAWKLDVVLDASELKVE